MNLGIQLPNAFGRRILYLLICATLITSVSSCKKNKKIADVTAQTETPDEDLEAKRRAEAEKAERERLAREKAAAEAKTKGTYARLEGYFASVAESGNVDLANRNIREALNMFSSPETTVLIVIKEIDGEKDYDRPTNIRDYLNYLKDTKKNLNRINHLKIGDDGKIQEVELIRK